MSNGYINVWTSILPMFGVGALLAGCTGSLESAVGGSNADPGDGAGMASGAGGGAVVANGGTNGIAPLAQPLQRLNRRELTNTVRQLFADPALDPTRGLPEEAPNTTGFPAPSTVSILEARALLQTVERMVEGVSGAPGPERYDARAFREASRCRCRLRGLPPGPRSARVCVRALWRHW